MSPKTRFNLDVLFGEANERSREADLPPSSGGSRLSIPGSICSAEPKTSCPGISSGIKLPPCAVGQW
jgi:hypothetical protein